MIWLAVRKYLVSTRPLEKYTPLDIQCCFDLQNVPVTQIEERVFDENEVTRIRNFDPQVVAFTSERGAEIFFKSIEPLLSLSEVEFYGIGPLTCSAVIKNGHGCSSPSRRHSEGLADLLVSGAGNKRVLLFRSGQANKALDEILRDNSVSYLATKAYDVTKKPIQDKGIFLGDDCFGVVFTSAIEVESFASGMNEELRDFLSSGKKMFSIGKYTTERLMRKGFTVSEPVGNSDFEVLVGRICSEYC